jgi:hypothetical protein
MKTIEYKIVDIDYFENDAILVVGETRYYFQFPEGKEGISIVDALDFMKKECIINQRTSK